MFVQSRLCAWRIADECTIIIAITQRAGSGKKVPSACQIESNEHAMVNGTDLIGRCGIESLSGVLILLPACDVHHLALTTRGQPRHVAVLRERAQQGGVCV